MRHRRRPARSGSSQSTSSLLVDSLSAASGITNRAASRFRSPPSSGSCRPRYTGNESLMRGLPRHTETSTDLGPGHARLPCLTHKMDEHTISQPQPVVRKDCRCRRLIQRVAGMGPLDRGYHVAQWYPTIHSSTIG